VQHPHRGRKAKLARPPRDDQRVLRVAHPGADHRVDVDVEPGVLGQVDELAIERLEALVRDLVGLHIVDADLQVLKPRLV